MSGTSAVSSLSCLIIYWPFKVAMFVFILSVGPLVMASLLREKLLTYFLDAHSPINLVKLSIK